MEQFTITNKTEPADMLVKVRVNTIYPAQSLVYRIKDAEFSLLVASQNVFDGEITYDHNHQLIFQKIGTTTDLMGWTILTVVFLRNLPKKVKTDADLKSFVLDPANSNHIDYWLKEANGDESHYDGNQSDIYKMSTEHEGRIFKHIQLT